MKPICLALLRLLSRVSAAQSSTPLRAPSQQKPFRVRPKAVVVLFLLELIADHLAVAQNVSPSVRQPHIGTVAELLRAARPTPETNHQIHLEGVVWYADTPRQRLVLGDASGAALLVSDWGGSMPQPGQRIRVSGSASIETSGGLYQLGRPAPLIDNTGLRTVSEKSRSLYLPAGRHPIELDYFVINGLDNRAVLEVTYEGPDIPRQAIPNAILFPEPGVSGRGLQCQYYEGFWPTLPDFTKLTPVRSGRARNFDLSLAKQPPDQCGLRFRGQINIARTSQYTFYLRSRDGSWLFVGAPALRWEALGTEKFPAPHPVAIGHLLENTNRFWAEVEGTVSFVTERTDGGVSLELCDDAGCLYVEVPDRTLRAAELANRAVRLRGYCESARDSHGRTIAGLMLVPSRQEIDWLEATASHTNSTAGTNLLTTIQSVRRLKPETAKAGLPVKVRGVVTNLQQDHNAFTIQDLTGGLYVINSAATRSALPELREFVEVEGVTRPGVAEARKITRLGWGVMPEPVRPSWDQLMNGSLDARLVEIRGIIDSFHHRKNGWSRVNYRTRDGVLAMDIQRSGVKPATLEEYLGAVIRMRGCLFGSWDIASGRVKAAQIRMSEVEVFVDEPSGLDLFSLPAHRIAHLTRFDPEADPFRRAKIAGQIIFVDQGEYLVTDGEEGVRFAKHEEPGFQVGDLVEAVGIPTLTGGRLYLSGPVARKTGHAPLPTPRRLSATDLIATTYDATLIRVEGLLAGVKTTTNELTLEIQVGTWRLLSHLKTPGGFTPPALQVGSRLELTGVYSDERAHTTLGGDFAPIDLLLRGLDDIRVLTTPPWWTLRRLTYVVGGLAFVAAFMLLWITLLHRKVEERTHEVKALNRDLQERARALELANKELESFSYSVSHDLRAPLRSIDGFSRAVQEDFADKLDAEGKEYLQIIRAATQRMGHLIDDMLMLAKVARTEIRRAPFDLSALAAAVARELQTTDPGRVVEFVITPELRAAGDAALTRIALENLLGNAWKFTSKCPAARIEVGRSAHNGATAFFVRDNGVGFDMTYADKLFGAFQRLHTVAEFPGTGVGLASTQRIIHRQGGRIWAESRPGHGATFYFTLPAESSHENQSHPAR